MRPLHAALQHTSTQQVDLKMVPLAVCTCSRMACERTLCGGRRPRRAVGKERRAAAWSGKGHPATAVHWMAVLSSVAHVTLGLLQSASAALPSDELMQHMLRKERQKARCATDLPLDLQFMVFGRLFRCMLVRSSCCRTPFSLAQLPQLLFFSSSWPPTGKTAERVAPDKQLTLTWQRR